MKSHEPVVSPVSVGFFKMSHVMSWRWCLVLGLISCAHRPSLYGNELNQTHLIERPAERRPAISAAIVECQDPVSIKKYRQLSDLPAEFVRTEVGDFVSIQNPRTNPVQLGMLEIPAGGIAVYSEKGDRLRGLSFSAKLLPSAFKVENSAAMNQMVEHFDAKLSVLPLDAFQMEAMRSVPFPVVPKQIEGAGSEKLVFDLGDGRVLKMSSIIPEPRRTFDNPPLDYGMLFRGATKLYFWTEEKVDKVTAEEVAKFEEEKLLPFGYQIVDFHIGQFGKRENGEVVLIDQAAVDVFTEKKGQPVARQFMELKNLLERVRKVKSLPRGESGEKFMVECRRDLFRIERMGNGKGYSLPSEILVHEIENHLADLEYGPVN